jgi:hypothetical protein
LGLFAPKAIRFLMPLHRPPNIPNPESFRGCGHFVSVPARAPDPYHNAVIGARHSRRFTVRISAESKRILGVHFSHVEAA